MGRESMKGTVRERGRGERGRDNRRTRSYTSYSNKWATDTKGMVKRKKEQGAEIRKRD